MAHIPFIKPVPYDKHQHERRCAWFCHVGFDGDIAQVRRLSKALDKIRFEEKAKYSFRNAGPRQMVNIKKGFEEMRYTAINAIVDPLVEEDGPLAEWGKSHHGPFRNDAAIRTLREAVAAADLGIWTEDGVEAWDPEEEGS